jgi:hypothetical protein
MIVVNMRTIFNQELGLHGEFVPQGLARSCMGVLMRDLPGFRCSHLSTPVSPKDQRLPGCNPLLFLNGDVVSQAATEGFGTLFERGAYGNRTASV